MFSNLSLVDELVVAPGFVRLGSHSYDVFGTEELPAI